MGNFFIVAIFFERIVHPDFQSGGLLVRIQSGSQKKLFSNVKTLFYPF
jgi:hypothetical protein